MDSRDRTRTVLATMRRLSSQNVILDILVTHIAAIRAQNSRDSDSKTAGLWEGKASSLPSFVGRCLSPLLVATNTVPHSLLLLLLVRFEVPTNS